MKHIFQFKPGAHIKGDPQVIGERLSELEACGRLTPESVLLDAEPASSVLHPLFEWDDSIAARRWRLDQAGHLIRCVTVVVEKHDAVSEPTTVRAFVPISGADETRSYVPTLKALGDVDLRKQVLAQAHSELGAVARKYRELKELADVVQAIDKVGELLHSSAGQAA